VFPDAGVDTIGGMHFCDAFDVRLPQDALRLT
jgi:hypothetical protein